MGKRLEFTSYKDYLGNTVYLEDIVIFIELHYRTLKTGKVIRITDKQLFIEYKDENNNEYERQVRQWHHQTVKLPMKEVRDESNKS